MGVLARLAHIVHRRRRRVVGIWALLTIFGVFATAQVSNRWFESVSIPGYSAYETNQKTIKTFGSGELSPLVRKTTTFGGRIPVPKCSSVRWLAS